jgi:hypothetical protein
VKTSEARVLTSVSGHGTTNHKSNENTREEPGITDINTTIKTVKTRGYNMGKTA